MTPAEIRAALADQHELALALTLYGEAAGESLVSQIAAACTVRARVMTDLGNDGRPDWWGEGYAAVCLKSWQYSCWWQADEPNTARLYAIAERVLAGQPVDNPKVDALLRQLRWIARGVISGDVIDSASGATHYVTTSLYVGPMEKLARVAPWAIVKGARRTPCATVGRHTFFSGVG